MSEKRRGLGRGLGALIPSGPVTPTQATPDDATKDSKPNSSTAPSNARRTQTSKNSPAKSTAGGKATAAGTKTKSKTSSATGQSASSPKSGTGRGKAGTPSASKQQESDNATTRENKKTSGTAASDTLGTSNKSRGRAKSSQSAGQAPSAGTSKKQAASRSSVSRETSVESSDQIKNNGASGRGRRDMGQALRNTTTVRRPVDMFFLPADDIANSDGSSQSSDQGGQSSEMSRTTDGESVSRDVSRETSAVHEKTETSDGRGSETAPGTDAELSAYEGATVVNDEMARAVEKRTSTDSVIDNPAERTAANTSEVQTSQAPAGTSDSLEYRAADNNVSRETSSSQAGSDRTSDRDVLTTDRAVPQQTGAAPSESATELTAVPGANFAEIAVTDIHPNRKQPRQVFDEDELAELAFSVKELGVLQPVVVRPSREGEGATYELVMGERRWRAVQKAGLDTIPAIIRETSDDDLLRDALLENLHRSQLNPLEEAAAYQQLMEEFGATQDELSQRIGRSRPQISNTLRLLRLPPLVQRRVAAGVLSSGHARALLGLTDPAEMERLAQRIVAEGMSVRATEEAVALSDGLKRHATKRKTTSHRHDDRLNYIADAFSDRLDTSVKIQLGARKGKMTIEFASVEDLNRIIDVLDPKMEDRG